MKTNDKVVWQSTPPKNASELWGQEIDDKLVVKKFHNGKWKEIGCCGSGGDSVPEAAGAISTTSSELRTLRDQGKLIPGQWYRITDYTCDINPDFWQFMHTDLHQFDIIIMAVSQNRLEKNCYADYPLPKTVHTKVFSMEETQITLTQDMILYDGPYINTETNALFLDGIDEITEDNGAAIMEEIFQLSLGDPIVIYGVDPQNNGGVVFKKTQDDTLIPLLEVVYGNGDFGTFYRSHLSLYDYVDPITDELDVDAFKAALVAEQQAMSIQEVEREVIDDYYSGKEFKFNSDGPLYLISSDLSKWRLVYDIDNNSAFGSSFSFAKIGGLNIPVALTDADVYQVNSKDADFIEAGFEVGDFLYGYPTGTEYGQLYFTSLMPSVGDLPVAMRSRSSSPVEPFNATEDYAITEITPVGSGVITELIDDHNNKANFDFKNIVFATTIYEINADGGENSTMSFYVMSNYNVTSDGYYAALAHAFSLLYLDQQSPVEYDLSCVVEPYEKFPYVENCEIIHDFEGIMYQGSSHMFEFVQPSIS